MRVIRSIRILCSAVKSEWTKISGRVTPEFTIVESLARGGGQLKKKRRHMQFKDRLILITGASGGIGAATALAAARRGARPLLVARREPELKEIAARIAEIQGGEVPYVVADVTAAEDRRAIRTAVEATGRTLDILVHNAGITAHGRFDESQPEVFRKTMELNFFAVAELTGELLPLMKRSPDRVGRGLIALVSTPSGLHGVPGRAAYSTSKAAGHALMETLRIELRDQNIGTLIFCPGYTRTALRTSGLAADGGRLSEEQAAGALEPEAVADMLCDGIERERRIVFTGNTGRFVYWLRTLAPGFLEQMMAKKLREDFQPTSSSN